MLDMFKFIVNLYSLFGRLFTSIFVHASSFQK